MQSIDQIINHRRAVRVYDENADYNPEITKKCVERATLAPNSSNMQLWEFYKVSTPEVKSELAKHCMNQSAARTANEFLVVVVRRNLWKDRAQFNLKKIKESFNNKPKSEYTKRDKRSISYYAKLMPNYYKDFFGIYGWLKYILVSIIGLKRPIIRQVKNADVRISAHKSAALAAQTFMLSMAAEGYDTCPLEGFDSVRVRKLLKLPASAEINMIIACGIRRPEGVYHERRRLPFDKVYFEI